MSYRPIISSFPNGYTFSLQIYDSSSKAQDTLIKGSFGEQIFDEKVALRTLFAYRECYAA
jgi:hypothetical protein